MAIKEETASQAFVRNRRKAIYLAAAIRRKIDRLYARDAETIDWSDVAETTRIVELLEEANEETS